VFEEPYLDDEARPVPAWALASRRLAEGDTYWLATSRPDGRPHVMPVLAVWVDGRLHFAATAISRKARNLAMNASCAISTGGPSLDLVLEGEAAKVTDETRLERVAEAYGTKYQWPVTVRDGALAGEGAPTAGPPPYAVYEVIPTKAFGFGTDESLGAARWTF
jgi:hypothetical protein